jgi:hypothetical protein
VGATSKTVLKITCDNPNCPGTALPSDKSYDGWYRVTVVTQQTPATTKDEPAPLVFPVNLGEKVYCSPTCAATIEQAIVEEEAARGDDQQN